MSVAIAVNLATVGAQESAEDAAIRKVIADRQSAWTAGDEQGCARLLTPAARSRTVFVLVKQADRRWLIAAQRAGQQDQSAR